MEYKACILFAMEFVGILTAIMSGVGGRVGNLQMVKLPHSIHLIKKNMYIY